MFGIMKKQNQIQSIAVEDIFPNPFQPRRMFDEKELSALGESIRENGLIQPVAVRKTAKGFELIAGERRLRACKLIGKKKIEAVVYEACDRDSAIWALLENLQREDLSAFEEAQAMEKLVEEWGVTREEAAKRLGIAPSTLSNKLRLLKIEPEIREIITLGGLTERHAREILRLGGFEERKTAARHIAEKGLSVAETERYIDRLLLEKPKRKKARYAVKDLRLFINTFEHAVEVMNSAGLGAVSTVTESEENIIYVVSIPKSKAFRVAESSAKGSAAPVRSASAPSVIERSKIASPNHIPLKKHRGPPKGGLLCFS